MICNNVNGIEMFTVFSDRYGITLRELGAIIDLDALAKHLEIPQKSFFTNQALKTLQFALKTLSPDKRFLFVNLLKRILKSWNNAGDIKSDSFLQKGILSGISDVMRQDYWNGHRAAVCMTHDVDYLMGYDFVETLSEMDKKYTVKSTFNFLTGWDYKIHSDLVLSLAAQGFEIGLHGHTHDIAMGTRGYKQIKSDLQKALHDITFSPISGFRAPALSVSKVLLNVLSEIGFSYDSSILGIDKQGGGILYCFPFKYPGVALWEVPLSIQDTYFFRDRNLTDDEAFNQAVATIDNIIGIGGVAVINCHPCIIKDHLRFYERLLKYIANQRGVWNPLLIELVTYIDKKVGAYVQE